MGEIQNLEKEPSRIVIPAKRPYSSLGDSDTAGQPPVRMAFVNQQHVMFSGPPQQPPAPPQNQPPQRRGFDYSRLGTTDRRETFGKSNNH